MTHIIGAFKAIVVRDQYGCHCPQQYMYMLSRRSPGEQLLDIAKSVKAKHGWVVLTDAHAMFFREPHAIASFTGCEPLENV